MKAGPVAVAAALVVAIAVGAASAATFSDPTGDTFVIPADADATGIVAIDVGSVEVTNTPEGAVTFRVTVTNASLGPGSVFLVVLDLDKDLATGDDGAEALLSWLVDETGAVVFELDRWNGTELVTVTTTASAGFADGVLTLAVPRSELLNTRGFGFAAVAFAFNVDFTIATVDVVPDAEELLVYDLEGLPPPPPPRLQARPIAGAPARPQAGRRFVASTRVTIAGTGGPVSSGRASCVVRIGPKRLRSTGRLANSRAQCAMTVPRDAKGKTLRGTMTIRHAGATLKRTFVFRVA